MVLPEVHGAKKILDMNTLPEKQKVVPQNKKIIENNRDLNKVEQG